MVIADEIDAVTIEIKSIFSNSVKDWRVSQEIGRAHV